jgi:hypothetical protein
VNSLASGIRRDPPPWAPCPGRARHWYSLWGHVGFRSPVCVNCGHPNPRPLTDDQWDELIDYRDNLMKGPFYRQELEDAINARKAETRS